ncbi:AAA family ATPase [Caenimonas sedimenti]|uniref:AAA family ATPase n=1 Tax=Caenimonas sedimenti TaxID=2596921 RepID=A0A562ZQ45_9BURK|nr:AAA family ATPase [Caenimonas sedimenti]TWO70699.1 AAA family ATPase [Caenimonas sedimenti]
MNKENEIQTRIAHRSEQLRAVREELKAELFGIDDIIDRVVEAVRAWYVLPEIVQRPVIVCLWGLTGTGKTQLVRLLAQKLGFYDRFVEVQMDGFSHGSGYWVSSISGMLAESGVEEGQPGILLLDEFQRFRTMNDKGADIKVERYQDVWALLSDGRLPPQLSFMNDLESSLASAEYGREPADDEAPAEGEEAAPAKPRRPPRFVLTPYEAAEVKRSLKRRESLLEIMRWTPAQLQEHLQAFREQPERWGTDYSRLLVFVAGNLDEMYQGVATRVEDCDTDADIFHAYTRRLSVIDVKKALGHRFRPEQIARLGNNHLVYPSLARATYERLITALCARYSGELEGTCGLRVEIDAAIRAEIYANAVFPAQGTRPLFSSVQAMLSASLVAAALWALEQGAAAGDVVRLRLDADRTQFRAEWNGRSQALPARFELNGLKQRTHADFRALLAVHEAGHALIYALLLKQVPLEVKINVASFDGGYNSFQPLRAKSRQDTLDMICVGLGGRAAESLVFGPNACTTGAQSDLKQATADASAFVRKHAFAGRLSRTDVGVDSDCEVNTAVDATNELVEQILSSQFSRAHALLQENAALLSEVAGLLSRDGEVSRERMAALFGLAVTQDPAVLAPYAARLAEFGRRYAPHEEAVGA